MNRAFTPIDPVRAIMMEIADLDAVSSRLADELDTWAGDCGDDDAACAAQDLAQRLRLLGWLVSVERAAAPAPRILALRVLIERGKQMLLPQRHSGWRTMTPIGAFSPPRFEVEAADDEDEDEDTVRKPLAELSTMTNRALLSGPRPPRR